MCIWSHQVPQEPRSPQGWCASTPVNVLEGLSQIIKDYSKLPIFYYSIIVAIVKWIVYLTFSYYSKLITVVWNY